MLIYTLSSELCIPSILTGLFLQEPGYLAFHILTDAQNFYAMKHWFARNSYKNAAIHVLNYEAIILERLPKYTIWQLYLPEEFRVLIRIIKQPTENTRMKYLSLFSHSHFVNPEIFKYMIPSRVHGCQGWIWLIWINGGSIMLLRTICCSWKRLVLFQASKFML